MDNDDRSDPSAHTLAFWDEVERVFSEAVEREQPRRAALLDERCAGRDDLRAEVESLLDAHVRAARFMDHPTLSPESAALPAPTEPERIGSFRLIERVAGGGMGTVYKAERADGDFTQRVAIKIIHAPIAHEESARRFRAERQILASLQHPNIVTLIDGGVTPDGRAYLVMEFVDGVPITEYCRRHALSVRARLRLFQQVCGAVQYAHAHFVVHRDLKPGNVLVTDEGVAKVLDFGIARLTEPPRAGTTASPTLPGVAPLTPDYASPEQLRGLPVTTVSDVYALGILLYELLAGTRPYETAGKPLDEVLRLVVDRDTTRPSAARPTAGTEPPYEWHRALKGDLDAIALRALHKDPAARYASADALTQDIGRFLAGVPVEAREPSLLYVLRKLAGRHRIAFTAVGVSAALVVTALGVALWETRAATLERRRADRRFNDLRGLANALIFKIHDAVAPLPGSTPVRRAIVHEGLDYLERLAPDSEHDPTLQVELGRGYLKIGSVQGRPNSPNLGDREGAIASFQKARALLAPAATAPGAPLDIVRSYLDATQSLSETLSFTGRRAEGITAAQAGLATAMQFAARHPDDAGRALVAAAEFRMALAVGAPDSLAHWKNAGAIYDDLLEKQPHDAARQRNAALVEKYLGSYFDSQKDFPTGLAHHTRALALDQQRYEASPDDRVVRFDIAIDLGNMAYAHWQAHDRPTAIGEYQRSLALREQLLNTDPADIMSRSKVAFIHRQLGSLFRESGDPAQALAHYRLAARGFEDTRMTSAIEKRDAAFSWGHVAQLEAGAGRRAESCRAFTRAFELFQGLNTKERGDGFTGESDPLQDTARGAADCGVAAAVTWLHAEGGDAAK